MATPTAQEPNNLGQNIFQNRNPMPTGNASPFQNAIAARGLGGAAQGVLRNQMAADVGNSRKMAQDQARAQYMLSQGQVLQSNRNLGRAVEGQQSDQDIARKHAEEIVNDYKEKKLRQLAGIRESIQSMRDVMAKHLDNAVSDSEFQGVSGGISQAITSGADFATNIMSSSGFSFLKPPAGAPGGQQGAPGAPSFIPSNPITSPVGQPFQPSLGQGPSPSFIPSTPSQGYQSSNPLTDSATQPFRSMFNLRGL